jgi:hypothetical protein
MAGVAAIDRQLSRAVVVGHESAFAVVVEGADPGPGAGSAAPARAAWEVDQAVAYKIRFGERTGPDTYIKLGTDGMLLAEARDARRPTAPSSGTRPANAAFTSTSCSAI